jgi:hypothetical protein
VLSGPFRWIVPSIECIACAERASHDSHETYRPANDYRRIAADFIRMQDDESALAFVAAWGLVGVHRLESAARERVPSASSHSQLGLLLATGADHDARPDLIDDLLEWSARAAALHDLAYDVHDDRHKQGLREVAAVIRTMAVEFVPERGLTVQVRPTTLIHLVFYALLGLYRGNAPLVCAEWLASGCPNDVPFVEGPGRPRKYCSERCATRARNRRRRIER